MAARASIATLLCREGFKTDQAELIRTSWLFAAAKKPNVFPCGAVAGLTVDAGFAPSCGVTIGYRIVIRRNLTDVAAVTRSVKVSARSRHSTGWP